MTEMHDLTPHPRAGGRPIVPPANPAVQVSRFNGGWWVIYRLVPRGYARAGMPRFRHPTFDSASVEATRLATMHPESTFVLLQEAARVFTKAAQ